MTIHRATAMPFFPRPYCGVRKRPLTLTEQPDQVTCKVCKRVTEVRIEHDNLGALRTALSMIKYEPRRARREEPFMLDV